MAFKKAERKNSKLRLALSGPSGSGKTWWLILIFKLLGIRFALLDSERSSALKYARKQNTDETPGNWDFDHDDLDSKYPASYVEKIHEARDGGYLGLGIDSYSHSWIAALEQIDAGGGWSRAGAKVSPRVAKLVDAILSYPGHVICTFRAKSGIAIEQDGKGKTTVRKLGLEPVARDGTEFEFDLWLDLERDGTCTVSKSRFEGIPVGEFYTREDVPRLVELIKAALDQGVEESAADQWLGKLQFADSTDGLKELVAAWTVLRQSQAITDADHERMKAAYTTRKRELTGAV